MCTCSMSIDIIYLIRCHTCLFHCKLHCHSGSFSVLCRGCDMISISCRAISCEFCVNLCTSRFCVFKFFQNYNPGSFSEDKSIPVLIKRAGSCHRIFICRQCCQRSKSCNSGRTDTALCTPCNTDIQVTILNRTECISDTVRSRCTCCHNICTLSFQAKLNGYISCCHIGDHQRNHQWIYTRRSFCLDLVIILLYTAKTSNT